MKLIEGLDIKKNANLENNNVNKEEINKNIENKEDINNNLDQKENEDNKNIQNLEGEKNEKEDIIEDNKNENGNGGEDYDYENDDIKEDFELGNQVVTLIEKDVNDLYLKKIIEQIKIDQINAITYVFEKENEDNPHEITLKIENGELYCIDGTKFSAWLIKHFSA